MATITTHATRARKLHSVASKLHSVATLGAELDAAQMLTLKERLESERGTVVSRARERLDIAAPLVSRHADEMDDAAANQDLALLFRLADKEQKLVGEIDAALQRMEEGTYGLCEGTGEPIGYRRLLARPWARFSVEYKEALERDQASRPGR